LPKSFVTSCRVPVEAYYGPASEPRSPPELKPYDVWTRPLSRHRDRGTKLQAGLGPGDGTILALERRTADPAEGPKASWPVFPRASLSSGSGARRAREDRCRRDRLRRSGRRCLGYCYKVSPSRGLGELSTRPVGPRPSGSSRVVLHNDADTAGLGEARFGRGLGSRRSSTSRSAVGSEGPDHRRPDLPRRGCRALEIGHLWVVDRISCDQDVLNWRTLRPLGDRTRCTRVCRHAVQARPGRALAGASACRRRRRPDHAGSGGRSGPAR